LRKEKETLEATEQQRPIDPMVGMMFQDFFSKKNLGMFLFFSPSNGSWFGGLGCVFVLSHPFCLFLSPTIPSLFQALSAVVSCPMCVSF